MGGVKRLEHVGLVVDDLETVVEFFADLGFEQGGGVMRVEGDWVDRMIGIDGAQMDVVSVSAPDGSGRIELTKFVTAADKEPPQSLSANLLGFRHVAYIVDDLDSIIERLRGKGLDTVGEIVTYGNVFRMCYVGGPEGLIVELAEELN